MKLQQLRYLAAVVQSDLNITAAAAKLSATQSAISKQLKLLEDELGFDVFARSGRTLTRVTLPGERLLRGFMYDLMGLVAPHVDRDLVDRAARCSTQAEVDALCASIELPRRP